MLLSNTFKSLSLNSSIKKASTTRLRSWPTSTPSNEPDFNLFEPIDYDYYHSPSTSSSTEPPCQILRTLVQKKSYASAREILSDLKSMNVPIKRSSKYTMAAIERLLASDKSSFFEWLPLVPKRIFHVNKILHAFFSHDPTDLDLLAILGETLPMNGEHAMYILAHLSRFSDDSIKVAKWLEGREETNNAAWMNQRDILLKQLTLTRRFDDCEKVLNYWHDYVPSSFTIKLMIQEGIKKQAPDSFLKISKKMFVDFYPHDARQLAEYPTLGPTLTSREVEEELSHELSSKNPHNERIRYLESKLFEGNTLPTAKTVASLALYYNTQLPESQIPPRLIRLQNLICDRNYLNNRAKALWIFARMIMQLNSSSMSSSLNNPSKRKFKASKALEIFLQSFLSIHIPSQLLHKNVHSHKTLFNILDGFSEERKEFLLWPTPFVTGAALTAMVAINQHDVNLHQSLWISLWRPSNKMENQNFNFIVPPSMKPDTLMCLPLLHAFGVLQGPERVRTAIDDMATQDIQSSPEVLSILVKAHAKKNHYKEVEDIFKWINHDPSKFFILHWNPPSIPSMTDFINDILNITKSNTSTYKFLESQLEKLK